MNAMKAYLDACIVIYYVQRHPCHGERISRTLLPEAPDRPQLAVTDLTRLECRVFPLRRQDMRLLDEFDRFFDLPTISKIPIDTAVFDLATELRAQHGLKTPDALHLAAAIHAGCDEFWTNDDRLAKAAAGRVTVVVFDQTQ